MEDVTPKLLRETRAEVERLLMADKSTRASLERIKKAQGTYEDVQRLADAYGDALVEALSKTITPEALPNGMMYQNIAEKLMPELLEDGYTKVSEIAELVQTDLNTKAGLSMKAVKAPYNKDKAVGLAHELVNIKATDIKGTVIPQQIKTFMLMVVDDMVHQNIDLQEKAGLQPQIHRRRTTGRECAYCQSLVYSGPYNGEGMPEDIFRRHRDCRCVVLYDPNDGKSPIKGAHSKREYGRYQDAVKEERKNLELIDRKAKAKKRK